MPDLDQIPLLRPSQVPRVLREHHMRPHMGVCSAQHSTTHQMGLAYAAATGHEMLRAYSADLNITPVVGR